MNNQKPTIEELINSKGWIKFTKRLELISSIFIFIGILLYYTSKSKDGIHTMLLTTGLSTIAMVYFFRGNEKIVTNSKVISTIFYKLYGYSLACTFVTFLFSLQSWPMGYHTIIPLCIIGILITLAVSLKLQSNPKIQADRFHFVRIFVAFGFLIIMVIRHF